MIGLPEEGEGEGVEDVVERVELVDTDRVDVEELVGVGDAGVSERDVVADDVLVLLVDVVFDAVNVEDGVMVVVT